MDMDDHHFGLHKTYKLLCKAKVMIIHPSITIHPYSCIRKDVEKLAIIIPWKHLAKI
jgi:hypothetical protein